MKPGGAQTGLAESFLFALEGILAAAHGRNFRIQAAIGFVAIVLGVVLRISQAEWLVVIACIALVLGGECFNTAIEDVVDLAVSDFDPRAKRAKDAAAGAVLVFSAASLVIGIVIFAPRLLSAVV